MGQFKEVHPVLPVKNVRETIAYFSEKLGFRLLFQDAGHDPKYGVDRRDGVEIHLQWHDPSDFEKVERPALRFLIDENGTAPLK